MQFIKHFSDIEDTDLGTVGGKGLNLGKLTKAGFPVPKGFCVTTDAYRVSVQTVAVHTQSSVKAVQLPSELITEIRTARETLQTTTFAVRSSATAEDLPEASFAGQQDTLLNVAPANLLDALKTCWASLWSERAIAYRQAQQIDDSGLAMAVVIQEMCEAAAAGVLFTAAPFNENAALIESNWGLGESVVSGTITPDSFHVCRETGEVLKRNIATKQEMVTAAGVKAVSVSQQDTPSLTDAHLKTLTHLGRQVESHYGVPMDIEWALTDGTFVLLQARHITITTSPQQKTLSTADIEKLRQEEIQRLAAHAESHGTIWSHHNLAEVLPAPLPMTWAVMKEFMSGAGGLGTAYRELGFHPSQRVNTEGILDLICGRIYVNLNREAELHFDGFPVAHDFKALKENPQQAMYAQAQTDITRSTAGFWLKLPLHIVRMSRAERRLRQCRNEFHRHLTEVVFPGFQADVAAEQAIPYTDLTDAELVGKFGEWRAKTLGAFAPKALTATLLAGFSLQRLEIVLQKCLTEAEAKALVNRLMSGAADNVTVETNQKLAEVAAGTHTLTEFLKEYGHRAVNEFELAQPRWREDPTYLQQVITTLQQKDTGTPLSKAASSEEQESAETELAARVGTQTTLQKQVQRELDFTRRYMPFRETAKFYLMLGYEQIRRALTELDRRYDLQGGIFYLVPDELKQLINGTALSDVIAERKTRRELMLRIAVPDVIFSDALEQIGRQTVTEPVDMYTGVGVSAGVATGPARVLLTPTEARPSDTDYILVCPSTDPAWTPLFLNAAGLVMERGGILSHGAVIAREYGVPAVAAVPNATRRIADGQMLQVDGTHGTISTLSETE